MAVLIQKKAWNEWLAAKGLSFRTKTEYSRYLTHFGDEKASDIELDVSQESIVSFVSKNNNLVARAFLKNLNNYIRSNNYPSETKQIIRDIELPKWTGRKKKRIPAVLNEDELFAVESALRYERDRLMLLICFYGGLRDSELCGEYAIKPYSFNFRAWYTNPIENGVLKVIGKGNKQRNVFIPQFVMTRTYNYITNWVVHHQRKDEPLFLVTVRAWTSIIHKASLAALDRRVNPHLLRHSCSMWLKSKGWDPIERQKYLGHSDVRTTSIYDHTIIDDLKKKFDISTQSLLTEELKQIKEANQE